MEAASAFSLEKERWPAAGETELGMCSRGKEKAAWEKEDGDSGWRKRLRDVAFWLCLWPRERERRNRR